METTPAHDAIFSAVQDPNGGNLMISSVAGSGKSTTIVRAVGLIPASKKVLVLAFNKKIALAMKDRIAPHKAQTLNSLGHGAWMGYIRSNGLDLNQLKLDDGKVNDLAKMVCGDSTYAIGQVTRLVRLAKSAGIAPQTTTPVRALIQDSDAAWADLIEHHDLDAPSRDGEDMPIGKWIELAQEVLRQSFALKLLIDYDDQIYMSVLLGAKVPVYDWVFVDESQDLSPLQHELVARAAGPRGRVVAVGDDKQACYGFRGASSESMAIMKARFNMRSLPLHVSYRCPQLIVQQAQKFVPYIQPHASAPMGTVDTRGVHLQDSDVRPGDMVVSRFSAPLIQSRLAFLKRGIPAVVMGLDLGAGLRALIKRLKPRGLQDLCNRLDQWQTKETAKAEAKKGGEFKVLAILDKAESLRMFLDAAKDLEHLDSLITASFSEDGAAKVTLCTIHKAKGLESERVFIINMGASGKANQDWQRQQEVNCCYIAVTRAKSHLAYVSVPRPQKSGTPVEV